MKKVDDLKAIDLGIEMHNQYLDEGMAIIIVNDDMSIDEAATAALLSEQGKATPFTIDSTMMIEITIESLRYAIRKSNEFADNEDALFMLWILVLDFYSWHRNPLVPSDLPLGIKRKDRYSEAKDYVEGYVQVLAFSLALIK